ncbi:hypothetical protein B0H13DRAFT_1858610 [Mycena leptocephala]|nr:hypothetical protein B0H13DRAFT_1858610 [Mycena leptocephala]
MWISKADSGWLPAEVCMVIEQCTHNQPPTWNTASGLELITRGKGIPTEVHRKVWVRRGRGRQFRTFCQTSPTFKGLEVYKGCYKPCTSNDLVELYLKLTSHHTFAKWFDLIVKSRPASSDENLSTITTVDDLQNGMLLGAEVHIVAESRQVAVLKTPNLVLGVNDIPACHTRVLPDYIKYPDEQRYTLQWLDGDSPELLARIPNNSDATFRKFTHVPKPSPVTDAKSIEIRHTFRGANSHLGISNWLTLPRPRVPVPAATGPIRTERYPVQLDASIQKRATGIWEDLGLARGQAAQEGEVMDPDEIVGSFGLEIPPQSSVENGKQRIENAKRKSMLPA